MNLIPEILEFLPELKRIRHTIHQNPETGFQEWQTAELVASRLESWGLEVHRNVGETGVVGLLRGKTSGRTIGLRADMDALPMQEATNLPYKSLTPNVFHGCGHDGHTTMLLGAAHYLSQTRRFSGTVVFIFQPAEEGLGGARRMLADGLFTRFPCDEIYAVHTWPNAPLGRISLKPGAAMAAADNFDITITGRGAHGAQPHFAIDPVMVAISIAQAIQTIVSRNLNPLQTAIVSITQIHVGSAHNVIPETAQISGTIRTFEDETRAMIHDRMQTIADSIASGFGATAKLNINHNFSVLRNCAEQSKAALSIAQTLVGSSLTMEESDPLTGSEDFADMLNHVPGAYLLLGQGPGPNLHNPAFDFNDEVIPIGSSLFARIVEERINRQ